MGYHTAAGIILTGLFATPFLTYLLLRWARRADSDQANRTEPPLPNHPRRSIPGGNSRDQ